MKLLVPLASMLVAGTAAAQASPDTTAVPPIQDNSFLVEEAYNQEAGVVQHISTFNRPTRGGEWTYTFTQEWPLRGMRHQISYALPLAHTSGGGGKTGLSDVAVNYRYQLVGVDGGPVAVAPRLSVLLPTGDRDDGLGAGGVGLQVNFPVSVALPARLVAHSNAGATWTPRAHDALGNRAATRGYALAQSVVWLARPRINLLVEGVWSRDEEVTGPGTTEWGESLVVSPGIRGAIDFPSGLQVVPGIAFPIGVGPSSGERSVFLYLSFEHPFAKQTR